MFRRLAMYIYIYNRGILRSKLKFVGRDCFLCELLIALYDKMVTSHRTVLCKIEWRLLIQMDSYAPRLGFGG